MSTVVPKCKGIHSNQDAFNKVWNHFITNRHGPGIAGNGDCITYDPARPHARCALGIMATPKECQAETYLSNKIDPFHDGKLYETGWIEEVLQSRGITIGGKLQHCHDIASEQSKNKYGKGSFINIMRTKMTELGEKFDLKVPA